MISFVLNVTETKPGTCAIDMRVDGADTATHLETEMAKALDVGIRAATMFIAKQAKGCEVMEGRDIEQFVQAALERAKK